jgi:hypothetical protein
MRRAYLRLLRVTLAAVLCVGVLGGVAAAQEAPEATITLRLEVPNQSELSPRVVAQVTDAAGSPVTGAPVLFSIRVEVGGERYATLGSGDTDASGAARVNLAPRREQVMVKARFTGNDQAGATETIAELAFPADRVTSGLPIHMTHSLLEPVQIAMPRLMTGAIAVLWLALIGLALQTRRATRQAALAAMRSTEVGEPGAPEIDTENGGRS